VNSSITTNGYGVDILQTNPMKYWDIKNISKEQRFYCCSKDISMSEAVLLEVYLYD
jgi:hypothetical protein